MKNIVRLFGIIIFVMVITLAFSVCDNSNDTTEPQTPTAADFEISNLSQVQGKVTPVTITPRQNKTSGALTIYYNGSETLPASAGTYPVTFDVASVAGFNAVQGLSAGNLTIAIGAYGIPIYVFDGTTNYPDNSPFILSSTHAETIKLAIDEIYTWGEEYAVHADYIKNNLTRINIGGAGMKIENGVARISVSTLSDANAIGIISGGFWQYAEDNM